MKMNCSRLTCLAALGFLIRLSSPAQAIPIGTIVGVPGSTAAPPAMLGSYSMTPFGTDFRPLSQTVSSIDSPLGGNVTFSLGLTHVAVGNGWATWSNGYSGDVYHDSGTTLTLALPQYTTAFYFYAEPNCDEGNPLGIQAVAQDGTNIFESVFSNAGASCFGFYATGAQTIQSITVNVPASASGFAIGEMGIATRRALSPLPIPEPGTWFMGIAVLGVAVARFIQQKMLLNRLVCVPAPAVRILPQIPSRVRGNHQA